MGGSQSLMDGVSCVQQIQYARGKSDAVAKMDGTFVPRKKEEERKRKADAPCTHRRCLVEDGQLETLVKCVDPLTNDL